MYLLDSANLRHGTDGFTSPPKEGMLGNFTPLYVKIIIISSALRSGAKHKTPGIDGFSLDFYIANWDTMKQDILELMNQMFLHKKITPQQKHGI